MKDEVHSERLHTETFTSEITVSLGVLVIRFTGAGEQRTATYLCPNGKWAILPQEEFNNLHLFLKNRYGIARIENILAENT